MFQLISQFVGSDLLVNFLQLPLRFLYHFVLVGWEIILASGIPGCWGAMLELSHVRRQGAHLCPWSPDSSPGTAYGGSQPRPSEAKKSASQKLKAAEAAAAAAASSPAGSPRAGHAMVTLVASAISRVQNASGW